MTDTLFTDVMIFDGSGDPLYPVEVLVRGNRIAAVAKVVPPDPPAEMMPPTSRRVAMKCAKASAMAATASPRSEENTAAAPLG